MNTIIFPGIIEITSRKQQINEKDQNILVEFDCKFNPLEGEEG
jgi:hypothetical protein